MRASEQKKANKGNDSPASGDIRAMAAARFSAPPSAIPYEPEPPQIPIALSKKADEARREALSRGEIPPEIIQALKLIAPDGEQAKAFQEKALTILKQYIPRDFWDFDRNPVRILLSYSQEPNAFYVAGSQPPTIGMTVGLFKPYQMVTYTPERFEHLTRGLPDFGLRPGKEAIPVQSISDFAAIVLHESVHAKEDARRGTHANDKLEEMLAYVAPLDAMHRGGLDARAMYRTMLLLLRPATSGDHLLARFVDPHPLNDNTLNGIRLGLTQLSYERGRVSPLETPGTPGDQENLRQMTELSHRVHREARQQRVVSDSYDRASSTEKAAELTTLICNLTEYDWERAKDISIEITRLSKRDTAAVEPIREAVLKQLHVLQPQLSALLYRATASAATVTIPAQLNPVNSAAKTLIDACTPSDDASATINHAAIEAASATLVAAIKSCPLLSTSNGRRFACYLPLTQFPAAKRDAVVPWEALRVASATSPIVTEAAVALGFSRDPVISQHILRHQELGGKLFDLKAADTSAFPFNEISWGPTLKVKADAAFLHQGSFTASPEDANSLRLREVDKGAKNPFQFDAAFGNADPRQISAEGIVVSAALDTLNSRPLSPCSTNEQCTEVHHYLTLMASRFDIDGFEPSGLGFVGRPLTFLTPRAIQLAPEEISRILFGYLQSADSVDQLLERQSEVLRALSATAKEPAGQRAIEALNLRDDQLLPLLPPPQPLTSLPLTHGFLSSNELLSPEMRLQLLCDAMRPFLRGPDDEQLVFKVLQSNTILQSTTPSVDEVLAAIMNQKTPWVARYTLTLYALREGNEIDVPSVLLALLKSDPENALSDSFTTERIMAYKGKLQEQLKEQLASGPLGLALDTFKALNRAGLTSTAERQELVKGLVSQVDTLPDALKRLEVRMQIIAGLRDEDDEIEELIKQSLPQILAQTLGRDDSADSYTKRVIELSTPLLEISNTKRRTELRELILNGTNAQHPLATALTRLLKHENLDKNRAGLGLGIDVFLGVLQSGSGFEQRRALLHYLSTSWSTASGTQLARAVFPPITLTDPVKEQLRAEMHIPLTGQPLKTILRRGGLLIGAHFSNRASSELSPTTLQATQGALGSFLVIAKTWHRQFTESSIGVKSAIVHQLLFPDGLSTEEEPHIRRYVAMSLAPDGRPHAATVRKLAENYLVNTPFVKRETLLTAITVASWKMGPRAPLGRTLVEVACALGPAEVKMIQRMRGHTAIPEEIRRDSATAVYRVEQPERLKLLEWVEEVRDHLVSGYKAHLNSVGRPAEPLTLTNIGEVKGCGSMGVTVKVTFSNGDSRVLYLVKPFAQARGEAGFVTFSRMAEHLPDSDPSKDVILDLLDSARRRISLEASAPTAKSQYALGVSMYRNKNASVHGEKFSFDAPEVLVADEFTSHGRHYGYFLMEEVPGRPMVSFLSDNTISNERKRAFCAAIVARELHNYLHFKIEPDRNEGNIFIDGSTIHHLDLKAMRPTPWSDSAKREIAPFLVSGLVSAIKNKQDLTELLSNLGGDRSNLSQEGFELLTEIETGLMSLAPYIQKLDARYLQEIALGVLDAGMDPILASAAARAFPESVAPLAEKYLRGVRGFFVPSLQTILKTLNLPDYASMVGRVNLSSNLTNP